MLSFYYRRLPDDAYNRRSDVPYSFHRTQASKHWHSINCTQHSIMSVICYCVLFLVAMSLMHHRHVHVCTRVDSLMQRKNFSTKLLPDLELVTLRLRCDCLSFFLVVGKATVRILIWLLIRVLFFIVRDFSEIATSSAAL